ncbi:MAG: MFS transporter [Meiothermus sp.]|nr:MFS transporter [Meiothermus sp.]
MKTPPWAYALGEFGLSLPSQVVGTYLTFYFSEQLGLALLYLALARGINTVWDIVNDPLSGYLSDRTRHPRGRRWPWLRAGLPLYVLAMIPLWLAPEGWGQWGLFAFLLVGLLLFETATTVVYLNHNALFPALYTEEAERVRVNTLRRVAGLLGIFAGATLSPLIFDRMGFGALVGLWAVVAAACLGVYFANLREPPAPQLERPPPFLPNLLDTLKSPVFALMLLVVALVQVGVGVINTGLPFYNKYVLGGPDSDIALIFGAVLGTALVSAAAWPWLARRLGLVNCWLLALGLFALALVPLWFTDSLPTVLVLGLPLGFAVGGIVVLQDVVLARLIDADAERAGRRREGAIYGSAATVVKLSGLLNSVVLASLTPLFGFVSGDIPGPDPQTAFRFLMAGPPLIALVLAFALAMWLRPRIA